MNIICIPKILECLVSFFLLCIYIGEFCIIFAKKKPEVMKSHIGNSLLFLSAALCLPTASAKTEHLLPKVKHLQHTNGGTFRLDRAIDVTDPTSTALIKELFSASNSSADSSKGIVKVNLTDSIEGARNYPLAGYPDEAYNISISPDTVYIKAVTPTGVLRAAQTLDQLAQGWPAGETALECVEITDWPSFKLRGWLHDVGRSFISTDELKREIDLLSKFKVNTFHWHLTDNTGWRLAVDAYPQLTGEKSITRFPGKFYSKDDAREIMEYAAERGITVIPEIDLPGHSQPFRSSMGFDMQTPEGKEALKVILKEVTELFDKAPYIHIGGDERSYPDQYIIDMIDYVHSLGKKVVIWNTYNVPGRLVNPTKIKTDMVTNWATSGRFVPGVPNVDMRYNYNNHFDVFADPIGIYKTSIFGLQEGNPDVAGSMTATWNDTMVPDEDDIIRQNSVYTSVLASASRSWQGGGEEYIETGGVTIPESGPVAEDIADWERRFIFHKENTLKDVAYQIPYVEQTNVKWRITDQIPNGGNPAAILSPERYIGAQRVPHSFTQNGKTYSSSPATGAGIYLRHIWHPIVKGFYDEPETGNTAYAWTYVYSPKAQEAGALVEFYTYSRSGDEKAPPAGQWDRRGSRLWVNGKEIPAPEWRQPDAEIRQDTNDPQLTNENLTAREPVKIELKKGWNQVMMKLPYAGNGGTKRNKWQFTFVLTDPSGSKALDNIRYSPDKK